MPRNAELTQQRLLDSAANIIAQGGIAALRVDQLAERAGVNKRMIYHYFGNKDGLARRVLEQQIGKLCAGLPHMNADLAGFLRREFAPAVDIQSTHKPDPGQLMQAAKIVLRGFIDGNAAGGQLTGSDWQALFLPLLRLALPETLRQQQQSERLLTDQNQVKRPRYKLSPGFRPT